MRGGSRRAERHERERRDWERTRARGEAYYLVTRGVLGRGLPMAVVLAVGIELVLGHELPAALATRPFLGRLALALLFFSVGGMLNARMRWKLAEKRFGGGA